MEKHHTIKTNISKKLGEIELTILVLYSLPLLLIIQAYQMFNYTIGKMTYKLDTDDTPVIEWINDHTRKEFWQASGIISTILYILLYLYKNTF